MLVRIENRSPALILVGLALTLGACAGTERNDAAPRTSARSTMPPGDWVDVAEFAQGAGLEHEVDQASGKHRLSSRGVAAQFEESSRVAYVAGELFVLDARPAVHEGRVFVPRAFTERVTAATSGPREPRAEQPSPRPIPAGAFLASRRFVVDAGHGGKDPGTAAGGVREKDVVLDVSRRLAALLRSSGAEVVEVRTGDRFVELDDRAEIADRSGPDGFISVHVNSASNSSASGIEIYRPSRKEAGQDPRKLARSAALANSVYRRVSAVSPGGDRGVKTNERGLRVVRKPKGPSILIEIGFVSNVAERRLLASAAYRQKIAEAIHDGVRDWAAKD